MNLSYNQYFDKVRGGWVGKCAGGILGAPIEGFKRFNDIEISDKLFESNFPNDDLDLQVLWLDMIEKKGVRVQERDFAEHWLNHVAFPWNEYGIAARNLKIGLLPPESGRLNNSYWKHSMGCPIRSEIWGMLCPGFPEQAARFAGIDGSLDHVGFSVHAEQYLSVCASLAFYQTDIKVILIEALNFIPEGCLMQKLVKQVLDWHKRFSFDITKSKIKSLYGDADFTSAPMNIGFTILTLLHSNNDFGSIAKALHLGHDSDCVVATAGALIGIINGYDNIPQVWKDRVGNEVLISDAITNIYKPGTVEELSRITCREGLIFCDHFLGNRIVPQFRSYNFIYKLSQWDDSIALINKQNIEIHYTNTTESTQVVQLIFCHGDIHFGVDLKELIVKSHETLTLNLSIVLQDTSKSNYSSEVEVWIDSNKYATENIVIPNYGSWLLLGPFIEDDTQLVQCDQIFPDHGMSELPSVQYMNHDIVNLDKDYLTQEEIVNIYSDKKFESQPFNVQLIQCSSFQIPFNQYYGKGERVIYLYSMLEYEEDTMTWINIGCTCLFKLYVNNIEVYSSTEIKRCWPGAHVILQNFNKGLNRLCIKLGISIDEARLEFGLKEYSGQHSHQSHWSLKSPNIKL